MKQYVIDELREEDYRQIKAYLDEQFGVSKMSGIYWVPLSEDIFSEMQKKHKECQPFYFALDLEPTLLACELLVRTKEKVRCDCMGYADDTQRNWLVGIIDSMFEKLGIKI